MPTKKVTIGARRIRGSSGGVGGPVVRPYHVTRAAKKVRAAASKAAKPKVNPKHNPKEVLTANGFKKIKVKTSTKKLLKESDELVKEAKATVKKIDSQKGKKKSGK
jgi:hypothetical protein